MLNANNDLTKYLNMNPQAFSYTMLGLSTLILAYFVGEDKTEQPVVEAPESKANELAEEEEEPEDLETDESAIEELLNKQTAEQRGGKKNKKRKTKRRK